MPNLTREFPLKKDPAETEEINDAINLKPIISCPFSSS